MIAISHSSYALQKNIDNIESKIANYVKTQEKQQLVLLEKLVNINSGTTNIAGVEKVRDIIKPEFDKLGFKTQWVNFPSEIKRAGTLIAKHPGTSGKKLLLIGHLDTVFAKNSSFKKFQRNGDTITGPGVIDDKGGDVIILSALKTLKSLNYLKDADITVVLTGDEEDSGVPISITRQPLFDAAKDRDVALDFEFALSSDTATTARRGISYWTIKTQNDTNISHSSKIFQKEAGYGAIYELTRILDTMRTELDSEQYLTFNPGVILGGTEVNLDADNSAGTAAGKRNVIARTAVAQGDLRFLTDEQNKTAQQKMRVVIDQHLPGTGATITFEKDSPTMAPTQANLDLLEQYSQASVKLGFGTVTAVDPGVRGAGDISHVAKIVPALLGGLGANGTGAHSEQETLEIKSLSVQTQRAALLIYELTR